MAIMNKGAFLLVILCCAGCACADRQVMQPTTSLRGAAASRRAWAAVAKVVAKKAYGHGCTFDGDCHSDHCIRFKCADGSKDSTCDNNGQCYAEECAGGKCWCDAGKCEAKLSVNSGCNDGAQCSSNSCVRFRCADAELDSTCDFNHQCKGSDTWCDAGRCKKKLPKDDGCNDGAQCSSGHCIRFKCADGTAGATCDNNAQCYDEDNMFCRAGKCISPKEEFSYREAKPECITNVKDQGSCGSCWAFATATAASQRLCLGHQPVSSVDLLCDVKHAAPTTQRVNITVVDAAAPGTTLQFPLDESSDVLIIVTLPVPAEGYASGQKLPLDVAVPTGTAAVDGGLCVGGLSVDGMNHMVSEGAIRIQKFPTPFGDVPDSICEDPSWGVGGSNRAGTDHTTLVAGKNYYDDGTGTNTPFRTMHWTEPHFVEKVKHAILTYGPVPVEMNIRKAFTKFRADPACWAAGGGKPFSRVESKSCCKKHYVGPGGSAWCDEMAKTDTGGDVRHAMVITGWGTYDGEPFWEVQNSYGTFEMLGGIMRIAQDYAREGDAGKEFQVTTSLPINWTPGGLVKPADVGSVSCGSHQALTCGACPQAKGNDALVWCSGDCKLANGSCGYGDAFHMEAWMSFQRVTEPKDDQMCLDGVLAGGAGTCDTACCGQKCLDDVACTHFTFFSDSGCRLSLKGKTGHGKNGKDGVKHDGCTQRSDGYGTDARATIFKKN